MTPEQLAWHSEQCARYRNDFPHYKVYAAALEQMLKAICRIHAPLAIVQARPKGFSSFAEKMARKAGKYMALNIGPTDLCGARVITETQAEVDHICAAIRGCDGFVIDKENSIDASNPLKEAKFGYLSVHYVVKLRGECVFGIAVPKAAGDRDAEIQVRTLLQHAWAGICHDRIYKSGFQPPQPLYRELARVAALLEEADQQFGASVRSLDAFKLHYTAYMDAQRLAEEYGIQRTVLDSEPEQEKKPGPALRLAQIARATGDWQGVRDLLEPYVGAKGDCQTEVLAEHGHALCRIHHSEPHGLQFRQGQAGIAQAEIAAQGDLRSRVLAYRAWASSQIPENDHQARDYYREACEADPGNPFHLAAYVGYEIYCGEELSFRAVTTPAFEQAIRACRAQADAGIELPLPFLTMGRFYLLLDQPYDSLGAYAKAIRLCLSGDCAVPVAAVDAELAFLRRIHRGEHLPESHAWVRDLLLLAKAVRTGHRNPALLAKWKEFRQPVVILAGGTAMAAEEKVWQLRDTLLRAFEGFTGTLISGGTRASVAGVAGDIADRGYAEVLGYVPRSLPLDQPADPRYTALVATAGTSFTAREPLQYWTDLLSAGMASSEVRVIGVGGSEISAFEYRIALALGARLAIVDPASRSAAALCKDPDWQADARLLRMPADAMTIRAFVSPPHPALTTEEVETAARRIHEEFLAENRRQNPDPAMKPWPELREDLKASNRMQAARAAEFLEAAGYRVRRASGAAAHPELTAAEIDLMAEMEHGRWVVDRLQSGWRFDAKRDPANKLSPYLVGWNELTDDVKGYDRGVVKSWPAILSAAGFEVVRP